jgi:hypothetical protein
VTWLGLACFLLGLVQAKQKTKSIKKSSHKPIQAIFGLDQANPSQATFAEVW